MRKWILHWLLGDNAKNWQDMFAIACECHADSKKLLESNESLLKKCKDCSDELIAVLNIIKEETDIYYLKMKVIEFFNKKTTEKAMCDLQSDQLEE